MDMARDFYTGFDLCYVEGDEILTYGGGIRVVRFDEHYIRDRHERIIGRLGFNSEVWDENNAAVARIYEEYVRGEGEYEEHRYEVPTHCSELEKAALFWGAVLVKR